ncbi:MAG: 4Fe-4S binding protein [Methanomethylovorans sp.]|nr:4Fe-4S binding protein [Methanomethylovorans sp.]
MTLNKGFIVVCGCKKCGRCRNICPNSALQRTSEDIPKIDHEICNQCMVCVLFCPNKAFIYLE